MAPHPMAATLLLPLLLLLCLLLPTAASPPTTTTTTPNPHRREAQPPEILCPGTLTPTEIVPYRLELYPDLRSICRDLPLLQFHCVWLDDKWQADFRFVPMASPAFAIMQRCESVCTCDGNPVPRRAPFGRDSGAFRPLPARPVGGERGIEGFGRGPGRGGVSGHR